MHAPARVDSGLLLLSSGTEGVTPSPQELEDSNGLLVVTDGGAALITGIDSGTVEVSLEMAEREPAPDINGWNEMVDVSIGARAGDLRLVTVLGDLVDLPSLSFDGLGEYRVRCLASGRALRPAGVEVEGVERYKLVVWSAPSTPSVVHRVIPNRYRREQ
ncbi:MAG: hypothetical protein LBE60_11105 [Microbacterium sp.]|jgi:hypothetical protein|uniref:hypothetical protein n=1 Tax=Microbacterium sp. TaxID=51671 RepID=UPI00281E0F6D|nr:hypothetical protein [Microbacterium sp.]MDR2322181.1 hypothetical protein [Microbacterium sp.]